MNHGTTTAYKRGCRCDACATAHYRYRKGYALRARERGCGITVPQTVAPDEAIEHLWALVRSGWRMTDIAAEAGMGRNHLWNIRAGRFARIQLATAGRILAIDPLPADVGPDEVVVDRLVSGADWRAIGATREERIAAAEKAVRLRTESLASLEERLGLRAGRDFRRGVAA